LETGEPPSVGADAEVARVLHASELEPATGVERDAPEHARPARLVHLPGELPGELLIERGLTVRQEAVPAHAAGGPAPVRLGQAHGRGAAVERRAEELQSLRSARIGRVHDAHAAGIDREARAHAALVREGRAQHDRLGAPVRARAEEIAPAAGSAL